MNSLRQNESRLLGSGDAIEELAKKTSADILAVSDSHGNKNLLRLIVANAPKKCDALVFCGDGICDLADLFDGAGRARGLLPPVVTFVAGNGDPDRLPINFDPAGGTRGAQRFHEMRIPYEQTFFAAGRKFFVTHGHRYGAYYDLGKLNRKAKAENADCVFYGHTHIARETHLGGISMINPGSCTYPRGGLPPSCAVVSTGRDFISATFYEISIRQNNILYSAFSPGDVSLF